MVRVENMMRADGEACRFSFNIAAWRAVSSRMADEAQWRAWAEDEGKAEHFPEYKPVLAFLPAMQRRRLGTAARLMFDAAWDLAERFPGCPMVYASYDGEVNRSFELWLGLLGGEGVSPTSFGLSVHNALAGQWSMLRGDMSENTALAVTDDGLESALAEAYALLQEGEPRVLVVVGDEPLRSVYGVEARRAPFPYMLAMVLEAGNDYTLALRPSENTVALPAYTGALDWIRFMLSDGRSFKREYADRTWIWQKK